MRSPYADGTIRMFVVRGRRFVAEAMIEALQEDRSLRVVGITTADGAAVERLRALAADVVLVDASEERERALEAVRRLRDAHPQAKVLAFGLDERTDEVLDFAEAGARACLPRGGTFNELIVAIHELHDQRTRCPPALVSRLVERIAQLVGVDTADEQAEVELTLREREVLLLLAGGLTNKEIAQRLGVAVGTVKNHVHNLLAKMHVDCRQDAVRAAYLAGLVDDFLPRRPMLLEPCMLRG